ncbi:Pkinase-domain-containing protein [Hyaloraphidium curvatum]|nr:Pkinase-domain-containing protein [Hyaloraphidium curvatum]
MAYDYDGRERGPRAPRWGDDRWRDAPTPPDFWERPPPPPPLPPALPPPPAWRDPHAAPDPRERAAEPDAVDEPRVKRLRLDADVYETIGQVGEGTYAKVFKARNQRTGGFVAVKRLRMENERDGFPFTAIREIKFLTSLAHENILQVQEAVSYRINTAEGRKVEYALVFEYMDHDLAGLLHSKQHAFEEVQIKCLVRQMLRGLDFLHSKGILHRDIKAANVLLNEKLQLKLADFGLARHATGRRSETKADCMTNRVVTLWYRAPELCLGSTKYGPEIDIWSVGCVMLEFFTYKAVFTGSDEISQLNSIWQICGTPNESNWPGIVHMEWYSYLKPKVVRPRTLLASCRAWKLPELAADLVDKLLEIDPSARPSAREAIKHPWFSSDPLPCERPHIPINTQGRSWHEFESKKRNGKQEANSTPEAGGGPPADLKAMLAGMSARVPEK